MTPATAQNGSTAIREVGDLEEAMRLVGEGWAPLGGGAALYSRALPQVASSGSLADLRGLGLDVIVPPFIGAGATLDRIAGQRELVARWPALTAAARATATPAVRGLATLGGTVAARLPASDLAAALDIHGTTVVIETDVGPDHVAFGDYWARGPEGPHLVVGVILGDAVPGCYRRFAGRRGPTPATASMAGVRRPDGTIELRAGAIADRPLAVNPVSGAIGSGEEVLRSDDGVGSPHRIRIVRALAREVLVVLG